MASRDYVLEVTGLKEATAGLDRVARLDVNRDLRDVFSQLTTEVISEARGRTRNRMQRRAAGTLVQSSSASGAAVKFGAGFPGSFGAEFGAGRNQVRVVNHFGYYHGWNQFDYWTGNGRDAGEFLWPAIRATIAKRRDSLAEAIAQITTKEGA